VWAVNPVTGEKITYGEVRLAEELQFSVYNFEAADVEKLWEHLRLYESEAQALLGEFKAEFAPDAAKKIERQEKIHERVVHDGELPPPASGEVEIHAARRRFPILPAYDLCLKCSHLFNLLDARGAISVTERVGVIARIRNLAVAAAQAYNLQSKAAA
jgi:glycyl-tRNA synthetase alpha chain